MKVGDRVRVTAGNRSLLAQLGQLGWLDEKAGDYPGSGSFLASAWLVRLDNRQLVLLWENEIELAPEATQ